MSQPTAYAPSTNFAQDEATGVSGRSTVRTARVDTELANVATTLSQILTNLALLQRDDTQLLDRVVTLASLSDVVRTLFSTSGATIRGAWVTATAYAVRDVVSNGTGTYLCATAHTSGVFATDLAAAKWLTVFDSAAFVASGVSFIPTGTIASVNVQLALAEVAAEALQKASNLSDLASAITARLNLGFPAIVAKGDLVVGSAADTLTKLGVGANGTIPMARSVAASGLAFVAALNKYIHGLTYANAAGDVVNDIDIATGGAMDATGAYFLSLAAAITKQSDIAWAVGTNSGGLDTGAVGNSDYYIWLIARSDTGVVDVLFSLSSTAPTMPANYDFKRLFGWFKRVGGAVVAFHTYETEGGGIEMNWDVPTLDINLANTLTTASRTDAVKVPLNFSTTAHLNVVIDDNVSGIRAWIRCPDQTSAAPSLAIAPLWNVGTQSTPQDSGCQLKIRTSAAGLIAAIADTATVDLYAVVTIGFTWSRR